MRPELQLALAESIPGATIHRIDEGHLACAMTDFGRVVREACDDVANRIERSDKAYVDIALAVDRRIEQLHLLAGALDQLHVQPDLAALARRRHLL